MDDRLALERARGAHAGRRCFIMGNGPSLNRTDVSRLQSEIVWATNRCYLLFDRISWRPSFYVARDRQVIENSREDIQTMIDDLDRTQFFLPSSVSGLFARHPNLRFFDEFTPRGEGDRFSRDPARGLAEASTVTVTCLQLAAYLGFGPIYLIGCDMSYGKRAGSPAVFRSEGPDPDHFAPGYLGKGMLWREPDTDAMRRDFAAAKKAADALGVDVVNATDGGQLDVFPRVSYATLFDKGGE